MHVIKIHLFTNMTTMIGIKTAFLDPKKLISGKLTANDG